MEFLIVAVIVLLFSNAVFFALMQNYRKKSLTDELSGLWNYRNLNIYISSKNKKTQLGLALLDIDDFKALNQINIHTGDNVLREFADALKLLFVEKAIVFRYRLGDEFALVFCNRSTAEIETEINLIQSFFKEYTFQSLADMPDYRISFCFGLSELAVDTEDMNSFFKAAELELSAAKRERKTNK